MIFIPRRARNSIISNVVHVISQGIKKEYIFNQKIYKENYFKIIKKNSKEFNIKIIAYCIMDNHVHMCLYFQNIENLSKFMHRTNTTFANLYNKMKKREGYVFKNRYYLQEIYDRRQLFNVISYIHNNPVKARMISHPKEYKYSSYMDYISKKVEQEIINLVFENEDYIDTFNYIHKNYDEKEIIEVKEDIEVISYKKVMEEFFEKYTDSIDLTNSIKLIKKDNNMLALLIRDLKDKSRLSGKDISNVLHINKNKVTQINKYLKEEKGFLTRPQILSCENIDKSTFAKI